MKTSIVAGDTFGDLTVIRRDGPYCVCSCKCNSGEVRKRADHLRSGATRTCGRCVRRGPKPADHVGERFDIVQIVEMLEDGYVLCQCDCDDQGKRRFRVRYDHLKAGYRRNCGQCRHHGAAKNVSRESERDAVAANIKKLEDRIRAKENAARAQGFTIDDQCFWVKDGKRYDPGTEANGWTAAPRASSVPTAPAVQLAPVKLDGFSQEDWDRAEEWTE
jgi:hypothetical protein